MALIAAGALWTRPGAAQRPVSSSLPPDREVAALDAACAPILALLPEEAAIAGIGYAAPGGPLAGRCDDWTAEGRAALVSATANARRAIGDADAGPAARELRMLLDASAATSTIGYGRSSPLGAIHRPYAVTAFAGPHLRTPWILQTAQPLATASDVEAWLARLNSYAPALLGAAQGVRADQAAGCLPPPAVSRAALGQMDVFLLAPARRHPLVMALDRGMSGFDAGAREAAVGRAATIVEKHVQPAMALLRDAVAGLTHAGRADIGLWAQPQGEALHAANIARAGDTALPLTDIQALARAEAERVAGLLDRRLALRGLRRGTLAERVDAAFAAHPEFIASDSEEGRATLLHLAGTRLEAARTLLSRWVPDAAAVPPLDLLPLPDDGDSGSGSFYLPAAIDGPRPAALWLDTRSVYALPVPGVAPLAFHLGVPGLHLLGSAARAPGVPRALLARIAVWPAMTQGWACYGERLAAEQGLFARDPWSDIARLSDELLRAARLVADIGIHAQRWPRAQAEAEMQAMTGSTQAAALDRIIAEPGEAAAPTLGLHRLLDLRDAARAKAGARFDMRAFHAAVLNGGARPFALVAETAA